MSDSESKTPLLHGGNDVNGQSSRNAPLGLANAGASWRNVLSTLALRFPFYPFTKTGSLSRGLYRDKDMDPEKAPLTMRPVLEKRTNTLVTFLHQKRAYIFVVCVFIAFMQAGLFSGHRNHEIGLEQVVVGADALDTNWLQKPSKFLAFTSTRSKSVIKEHPIPKLMEDAEAAFKKKVSKQSQTLQAAVMEYKKRYHRAPPKGFDDWWEFAKEHDVLMVDEYDGLMEDLEPFWEISGEELRRRAVQVGHLPSIDLVRVEKGVARTVNINNGFEDSEVSARANGFRRMMEQFEHKLPDLDFPINAKAEGRVLVPWEHRKYPNMTLQDSSAGIESMLGGSFSSDWGGQGNVWDAWRRTCPPDAPARRLFSSLRNAFTNQVTNYLTPGASSVGDDFHFPTSTSANLDYCVIPYAHYLQGHFFSDWRTIPVLYPVFSPAKAAGFMDIKIPSHYYYGSTSRYTYGWDPVNLELKDVDDMEVPWERKLDQVFWRGATTGGGSHPPGFSQQYQRHRFLRMASDSSSANRTVTFADPPTTSNYVSAPVPIAKLNSEIMDTAFVKLTDAGNYPGGLKAMKEDHRFGDAVPLGKHWSYKYLVDMDGMSYSGRFMAFLASDSVPVKATVYTEYFSDWIQPWLHFIPLSATYKEMYNIHAYFSGPTQSALEVINSTQLRIPAERRKSIEGDRRLRRIARAGKQWKKTIGRTIDMEVYVYRLCLEYARLSADDRDAMSFTL